MECLISKRLIRATQPSETGIKSEIEVCKFVLQAEIKSVYRSAMEKNKELKQRMLELEWDYVKEGSKKQKLNSEARIIQSRVAEHPRMQNQIVKVKEEITNLRGISDVLERKVRDRHEQIIIDQKYWRKLKEQRQDLEVQVRDINNENQVLKNKKQKLEFLRKEILRTQSQDYKSYQSISREKVQIKQRLEEKIRNFRKNLKQLRTNKDQKTKELEKANLESRSLQKSIQNVQERLDKAREETDKDKIVVKKLERDILEESNRQFQLGQRFKIEKSRLEKLKNRNQALQISKETLEQATRSLLQIHSRLQNETRCLEQSCSFQIEHSLRLLHTH